MRERERERERERDKITKGHFRGYVIEVSYHMAIKSV
jgi:hypothetical protein